MSLLYKRKKEDETIEVNDRRQTMIINTADSTVTRLNEAGAACWELLQKKQTTDSLVAALLRHGQQTDQVDVGQVKKDVTAFLTQMLRCGLIDRVGE
ncbi:MAG: PqqD family protein [Sporolactobacillus sp.]|jgi:hypothetical protein|nr:PqqD family protein [Sporolactobacillus sp.]